MHPLTTAILRALRDTQPPAAEEAQKVGAAAAPVRAPIAGKAAAALVVTPAQMAPRLRLLALACVHDRVRDAVWPLASGEGAYERLTRLLRAALGGKPSRHRPRRRGTAQGALAWDGVAGRKALRPASWRLLFQNLVYSALSRQHLAHARYTRQCAR